MKEKKNKKNNSKNTTKNTSKETLVKGVLDITRSGMGYVVTGDDNDIIVRPHDFGTAMHGDTVMAKVTKINPNSKRREGVIKELVTRKQTAFIGRIEVNRDFGFFLSDSQKTMPDFYIPKDKINGAVDDDRVVVKLVRWEKGDKRPVGEVVSILTGSEDNDVAMKELLTEAGFPLQFSQEVMDEAMACSDEITKADLAARKDFRETLTFTIDPVDAKDFDDAISLRALKNGMWEVGVHIADVSHFVRPGTALDTEAYHRATSVYLPDRVNPMLPERISNELCSLRPHEDKFTFSAVFEMNEKGEIKKTWLGRTLIHSNHRFTYEEVQEIIESKKGPYEDEVLLLNRIAQKLRKDRFDKGAINFSSQEVRFKLDEKGKPIGIMIKESKEAHQLIEELMLLANKGVAEAVGKIKIKEKPLPFPYRVHDTPDEEKLKPFTAFALKYGHQFNVGSPKQIAESFNAMLKAVKGKPEQHVLEQLGIRTMAKAIYTTENIGHYGLGFDHYCHFTSPIRRYPDVLVHRVLQTVLDKEPMVDKKMEAACKHCSEREKAAMESERAGNKYKQVEYLKDHLGETFEGVVSGVSSFGFWVETVEHKCEGLVSINSLMDYDEFRHIESDYCLTGRRSGRSFRMGDKVKIKVIAANLTKRQLDFEWVTDKLATPEKIEKDSKKKKKQ
jgi:ribonuclease R